MDDIGARCKYRIDLFAETREIGGENRRCNPEIGHWPFPIQTDKQERKKKACKKFERAAILIRPHAHRQENLGS
jgi:hypothetical protein